jgi:hypothetical protein
MSTNQWRHETAEDDMTYTVQLTMFSLALDETYAVFGISFAKMLHACTGSDKFHFVFFFLEDMESILWLVVMFCVHKRKLLSKGKNLGNPLKVWPVGKIFRCSSSQWNICIHINLFSHRPPCSEDFWTRCCMADRELLNGHYARWGAPMWSLQEMETWPCWLYTCFPTQTS